MDAGTILMGAGGVLGVGAAATMLLGIKIVRPTERGLVVRIPHIQKKEEKVIKWLN